MHCTARFTCITQCLATSIWSQAGLLTSADHAQVFGTDTGLPIVGSHVQSAPCSFSGYSYEMQFIPVPDRGCEPLGIDRDGTTAFGCYKEWRKQSFEIYLAALRDYLSRVYRRSSFRKSDKGNTVAPGVLVEKLTAHLEQLFADSTLLLKSREHINSVLCECSRKFESFSNMLTMIHTISEHVSNKDLESLDAAEAMKLDRIRMMLDCSGAFEGPNVYYDSKMGDFVRSSPRVINDDVIACIQRYCTDRLKQANEMPKNISRVVVKNMVQADSCLSLVYPEFNHRAWGYFWRAAQNQVSNELNALKKHVEELSECIVSYREYVPLLVEKIDIAMLNQDVKYFDKELSPEEVDEIIDAAVTDVANEVLDLSHGKIYEKTIIDEAAPEIYRVGKVYRKKVDWYTELLSKKRAELDHALEVIAELEQEVESLEAAKKRDADELAWE